MIQDLIYNFNKTFPVKKNWNGANHFKVMAKSIDLQKTYKNMRDFSKLEK